MSRPWKHPKTGVFWLRKRIPDDLRPFLNGKREELRSLGTKDPSEARRLFAHALAETEKRWANLRRGEQHFSEREAHRLAARIYDNWLAAHADNPSEQWTWHTQWFDRLWHEPDREKDEERPSGPIRVDQFIVPAMRMFVFRQVDFCIEDLGLRLDKWSRFRLAKAFAAAFQRASLALAAIETGKLDPAHFFASRDEQAVNSHTAEDHKQSRPEASGTTLTELFDAWWQEAQAVGRKRSTHQSYRATIKLFGQFLGHDDAGRLTAKDVVAFKNYRLTTPSSKTGQLPSPRTVKDSDLAAIKTVLGWGVANHLLDENVAEGITIKLAKVQKLRSKSFSDDEARAILSAALRHTPAKRENPKTAAGKKWVPWLCAFTGARVGEIAQLRKQDILLQGVYWTVRITPEAGTVKTNEARTVVLHPQIVKLGFIEFVEASDDGPLFLKSDGNISVLGPLRGLKNRLAEFSRRIVDDVGVDPTHGWRHRFKTIGRAVGSDSAILDVIQGHAPRSVAEQYGDWPLEAIAGTIARLPWIELNLKTIPLTMDPACKLARESGLS